MIYEDTYPSLIQGVSQQTPQERLDGQLGAQVNMLSDPVNGLRRRSGFKLHGQLDVPKGSKFDLVQLAGEYYIQCVTPDGRLVIVRFSNMEVLHDSQYPYLVHTNKGTIRSTISHNQTYILNTDKVPEKVPEQVSVTTPLSEAENTRRAWFIVQGDASIISTRTESISVVVPALGINVSVGDTYTGNDKRYKLYTVQERTTRLYNSIMANSTLTTNFVITRLGNTITMFCNTPSAVVIISHSWSVSTPDAIIVASSQSFTRAQAPTDLPSTYNGYYFIYAGAQYIFNGTRKLWLTPNQPVAVLNPKGTGWVRILSGAFSKQYTVNVSQGDGTTLPYSVTTHVSTAAQATPEYVATALCNAMNADIAFTSKFAVYRDGTSLAIIANSSTEQLVVEAAGGDMYLQGSGASTIRNKDSLPPTLPPSLDGYIQAVGTSNNLTYFQYTHSTRSWEECGVFEERYTIQNTPMYWYFDYNLGGLVVETLDIQGRNAGDDNNNPEPAFLGFGFTGISAYQSRLILLSGAYVCMSKSTDPSIFMRTTVEEVLDDDPIEISATSLSNAQFEYAVPYNKDLILFSQTQQAVIPANNAVLTPKSAVIYPSTQTEVSLAARPIVAARSLYYAYQRGLDYYQVGEMIPNPYTDSQYNPQNLTDHLPLYAEGVCTGIAGSSTNNAVMFTSDNHEVLVNQFIWQGDTRSIMGFHKWVLPRNVLDVAFLQEYSILFMEDTDGSTLVCTTNTQLNQLKSKPVPYLDIYQYVETDSEGVGTLGYMPEGDLVAVVYDDRNYRHMELDLTVDRVAGTIKCNHTGTVAIGLRFSSYFTLTPPYIKDQNGKVLAGVKSTVHSFPLTFRNTGEFKYMVSDFIGEVSTVDTSATAWSEVNLGYTWINSINTTVVPCRSRLDGLTCTIFTDRTTDMNLTTAGYVLRTARKHPRPRG